MNAWQPIKTSEGVFHALFTQKGLTALCWPEKTPAVSSSGLANPASKWIVQTESALISILQGVKPKHIPPLDLSQGTDFQQQVWRLLLQIPPGQTRTYGQLAADLGRPHSARAVGNACGANPIPLIIPCHRVLPASGGLGGFSGPMKWKKWLLEREKDSGHKTQDSRR